MSYNKTKKAIAAFSNLNLLFTPLVHLIIYSNILNKIIVSSVHQWIHLERFSCCGDQSPKVTSDLFNNG